MKNIENILVPIDGSEHANRAIEFAASLAMHYNAAIHLLHVCKVTDIPAGMKVGYPGVWLKDAKIAMEEFGRLDVLVNNAGGFPIKPFAAVIDEEWDEVRALDLKSVFLCSQIALVSIRGQRSGSIVNNASV